MAKAYRMGIGGREGRRNDERRQVRSEEWWTETLGGELIGVREEVERRHDEELNAREGIADKEVKKIIYAPLPSTTHYFLISTRRRPPVVILLSFLFLYRSFLFLFIFIPVNRQMKCN